MSWFLFGDQARSEFQQFAQPFSDKHVVMTNIPIALVSLLALQKKAPVVALAHLAGAAASTIHHTDETNVNKYLWDEYMGLAGLASHVVHALTRPRKRSMKPTLVSAAMTAALYHRSSQLWYKKAYLADRYNKVHSLFHVAIALTGAVHLAAY